MLRVPRGLTPQSCRSVLAANVIAHSSMYPTPETAVQPVPLAAIVCLCMLQIVHHMVQDPPRWPAPDAGTNGFGGLGPECL